MIDLGGREIEYRFARRRRRTLGITVDAGGLSVAAPLRAPWREVESFIRHKERWILRKLDEWARAPQPQRLRGETGETLPLFGTPVVLEVVHARRRAVSLEAQRLPQHLPQRLRVQAAPARVVDALVRWLKDTAHGALAPRAAHYAALLGRDAPRVTISNARTQWGVCSEDGGIRLSWRLVHLDPALADYVVAHEVAHLVELNHSTRFWNLVSSLYPDWPEARHRLEIAGAGLPILRKDNEEAAK